MPKNTLTRQGAKADWREFNKPRCAYIIEDAEEDTDEDDTEGPFDALLDEVIDVLDTVDESGREETIALVRTELGNWLTRMRHLLSSSTEPSKH